ncbi:MAG: putative lipid II flippase FtsW [Marinagarivorans sp.]
MIAPNAHRSLGPGQSPTARLRPRPVAASPQGLINWPLLLLVLALISFGVVMVASASMDFAAKTYADPWYFAKRHLLFLALGSAAAIVVFCIPSEVWNRFAIGLLLLGLFLLLIVLVPGIGKSVNGSRRWLGLGGFAIQASEVAKFCFVVFFASFLARRTEEFQRSWSAFFKLIGILGVFVLLLLMEPDFGTSVVLSITAGAMMFVAGVPLFRFIFLAASGVAGLAMIAIASPYRWQRLVTFLDPWAEQFSSGYQLVQSLIAFGRGSWTGLGLGNSLQKLFFLPEAHTDFIFAIIAEEFGLIGAIVLIAAFFGLVWKVLAVSFRARALDRSFVCFASFGIGIMLAAQSFINMGVASGLLPTKGLTLPFISSGGSSLIVCCAFLALVLRMDAEMRR